MSFLIKLVISVVLVFSLSACNDVLNKPLSGTDTISSPKPLEGSWKGVESDVRLDVVKTNKADWYEFTYQEQGKKTEGRFVVSHFKRKRVLNIDLASIKINSIPLVVDTTQAFLIVDANVDGEQLRLTPANMDKFEKFFSSYFFATPIQTKTLCQKDNELCASNFSSGNVLLSKRMKKFNDEFIKKYRTVFPAKSRVVFTSIAAAGN